MVPKRLRLRLSTNMQTMDMDCQTWSQPQNIVAFAKPKELKLKLSLEARNRGDAMVIHCQGRIVYRDEAAALSRVVNDVLGNANKVVLDLSGVSSIDSAGIGELALLHTCAQDRRVSLKCAGPNPMVRRVLELTNLDSVLDLHASVEDALRSAREDEVCADC
jgi:anti-sigma B factor antagonist